VTPATQRPGRVGDRSVQDEVIRLRGPWRSIDDVEFAVLEWVDWFNHRRLLEPLGHVPPAEYEDAYYRANGTQPAGTTPQPISLR
jgi:transposase InsO family protein